jgi:hypothetical protein
VSLTISSSLFFALRAHPSFLLSQDRPSVAESELAVTVFYLWSPVSISAATASPPSFASP